MEVAHERTNGGSENLSIRGIAVGYDTEEFRFRIIALPDPFAGGMASWLTSRF
jgi:hypothetical protein